MDLYYYRLGIFVLSLSLMSISGYVVQDTKETGNMYAEDC